MTTAVKRYSTLRLDRITLDQYGFLRTEGNATRVGVFKYLKSDGTIINEFRSPEEVFHADSVKTLKGVPITNGHPNEGVVNADNAKDVQIGYTGSVSVEDPFIKAEITITTQDGIRAVQGGRQELSCGYTCELDFTPGMHNGIRYDAIQRNIRYNHLAAVDQGRAGPSVRLKLDSEDAVEVVDEKSPKQEEKNMKKVKLGDKEFECNDDLASAIESHMTSSKESADKVKKDADDAAQAAADALKAEKEKADQLQAKVDHLEKEKSTTTQKVDAEEVKKAVKSRLKLEKVAELVLDADTVEKLDAMSDKDIKVAVIKADRKDFDPADKSDAYIDAAFDLATEATKKKNREDVGSKIITANDGTKIDADQLRKKSMEESENAWKKPLSTSKQPVA